MKLEREAENNEKFREDMNWDDGDMMKKSNGEKREPELAENGKDRKHCRSKFDSFELDLGGEEYNPLLAGVTSDFDEEDEDTKPAAV